MRAELCGLNQWWVQLLFSNHNYTSEKMSVTIIIKITSQKCKFYCNYINPLTTFLMQCVKHGIKHVFELSLNQMFSSKFSLDFINISERRRLSRVVRFMCEKSLLANHSPTKSVVFPPQNTACGQCSNKHVAWTKQKKKFVTPYWISYSNLNCKNAIWKYLQLQLICNYFAKL